MNAFRISALLALAFCLAACGSSHKLSHKTARKRILNLGLIEIQDKNLEIQKVSQLGSNQAVAEANLNVVFQLSRNSQGKWEVEAVRLSDRNWVRVATLHRALDSARDQQTRQDLNQLARGIREFKKTNGEYPPAENLGSMIDLLFPQYMADSIRFDAWGRPLILKRSHPRGLQLLSVGADGIRDTGDDIVLPVSPGTGRSP